jgi:hypothetical protein
MKAVMQLARAVMHSGAAASSAVVEAEREAMDSPLFRLPTYIAPRHYAMEFQPDTKLNTFAGAVYITIEVVATPPAPLTHLILHTLDLVVDTASTHVFVPHTTPASVSCLCAHPSDQQRDTLPPPKAWPYGDGEGRLIPCIGQRYSAASETVQLLFDAPLPGAVGDVFVLLINRFDGRIDSGPSMLGLYHSSSTNPAVISTQLEPTHARRLFPCFDEPAIQSTFQLSVVTEASLAVISNTEAEADVALAALPYCRKMSRSEAGDSSAGEGREVGAAAATSAAAAAPFHCVRFKTTPPLHTCIIGFHVGRFTVLEQRTRVSRVLCRVVLPHTEPNSSGWFALDLATKALDFFEEFFNVQLPLKKLDVVAMERFAVLGMENWGLINLHKDFLIVTGTTPLERRQRITRLIGHEMCHQWFGNWIAIEWWNCLWLKEGMCRYLEYFFVNAIFPSWGLWNEFLAVIMNDALLADADPSRTHPVNSCNSAPRRIYDSFDTISYGKGACVLRMMFSIIGTEWLRRATHLLMTRFANKSFNATDLGDCIVQTADERSSNDAQVQHAKAIRYALQMVEAVSHPYLYIRQLPGEGYHITQYVAPSKQHGLLVEYLHSQRSKADAPVIDLFSNPAHLSFQWTPEETLTRVSKPFAVPLRAARWHRGGHGSVRLIFVEEADHFVPLFSTVTAASPPAVGASSPVLSTLSERDAAAASPTSWPQQVCYFNHGGGGFYQCDYDVATWRQLFEFVGTFSDEDRMVITLHFINTAKAQLGHQPDTTGDRCTLFFEWLLKLTSTPGAMNSFLWDLVTRALTHIVQLVQQYYCQSVVKAFVNSLYIPLQKRCVLSFFAQEKTVSFQSSIHLSRHLVLSILQLLCLCENPEVTDEAEETAQWALARVMAMTDSPYHAATAAGSCTSTTAVMGSATTTTTAVSLSADVFLPHSSTHRPTAASPLATATSGTLARRTSQADLGSSGTGGLSGLHSSTTTGSAQGPKSSPMQVAPAAGHLLTNSFAGSAPRAGPAPQLASTPQITSSCDHTTTANLLSSFAGLSSATDWAGVKNNSIASYPYQRAAELNLEDASHIKAGEIALTHLASQGRIEHWVAAAAVAAEVLELEREALQRVSETVSVPVVRLNGLDRKGREDYLRLVIPAVFSFDREQLFPFMADVFASLTFLSASAVEALYRNPRFLLHLISHGALADRRVLSFVLTCGAEVCSNGFVIAQLKALAQRSVSHHHHNNNSDSSSASSSVEMFKGVEFADSSVPSPSSTAAGATTDHPGSTAESPASPSMNTSPATSAAPSVERSTLRVQSPAIASALDMMESNCVWMDYCCWHYNNFLREQRQLPVRRPTRSEANSSMQMFAPAGEDFDEAVESYGGVSI